MLRGELPYSNLDFGFLIGYIHEKSEYRNP
jgi:hypothetical protein